MADWPDMVNPLMCLLPRISFGCAVLAFASVAFSADDKAITLFDGESLKGWRQLDGTAKYEVRDGAIVGIVTEGSPKNTFLATNEMFEDFVFECEFKPDAGINSGVQFRSVPADEKVNRVYGYQYEIDPNPRALTGGIYEEGRRGWMSPSANNGEPAKEFAKKHGSLLKVGEWNTLKIECRGNAVRTWLNGASVVDFRDFGDNRVKKGFIALQIHRTNDAKLYGRVCLFRNLRIQKLEPKE